MEPTRNQVHKKIVRQNVLIFRLTEICDWFDSNVAAVLCLDEDDAWMDVAERMGLREEAVERELERQPDPVLAVFSLYRKEGGEPERFLQVRCEEGCKRAA